jgi:hypothetical protein
MRALDYRRLLVVHDHQWQCDPKRCPTTSSRTRRIDAAAVRFNQVPADRQAETEPAVRAREQSFEGFAAIRRPVRAVSPPNLSRASTAPFHRIRQTNRPNSESPPTYPFVVPLR